MTKNVKVVEQHFVKVAFLDVGVEKLVQPTKLGAYKPKTTSLYGLEDLECKRKFLLKEEILF